MIKNKDGSYNKFKLLIIFLIFIITISITGIYISQNIEIPKIETPSWTPTPTHTPTPSPTIIPIDPRIAVLYNSTNITYSNSTSWNWTYTNYTNTSNWTYPPEIIGNFTFVAGGGGQCYEIVKYEGGGGGQCFFENVGYGGSGGSSSNISYTVIAGGGGGAGYTSVAHINSTPAAPVVQVTSQETSNLSQNVSQIIIQVFNPLGSGSWMMYLIFIIPLIMMMSMRGSSLSMILPIIIGLVTFGYFFNIGIMPLLAIVGIIPMILIMSSFLSDR